MAGLEKLFNGKILNKSNQQIDLNDEQYQGKVIGLYFSAHWCPPCCRFTPILVEFYNKYHQDKNLEIILISADRDEKSFDEYYGEMPWLTLDYKEQEKRDELDEKFGISGMPTLILLDGDSGNIICKDARDKIQNEDKKGENFPWNSNKKKHSNHCILI